MAAVPVTRYTKSGDVNIAYQVIGDGPADLVLVQGWVSNVDAVWDYPLRARFLMGLASFSRLILFDKRGTGLSDRVSTMPDLETRMDDVRAVLDAVGSQKAALFGVSEGGTMCCLFAATYPERTSALIMCGSYARKLWAQDYPMGMNADDYDRFTERCELEWGGPIGMEVRLPSRWADPAQREAWARYIRSCASPAAAVALNRMNREIDIRHVLPAIRVPALVMHSSKDRTVAVENGRYLAEQIPGAKYIELNGIDHVPSGADLESIVTEVGEFLTGVRPGYEADRVLATVLFTDIVGSTEKAASLGDHGWRDLLERHHAIVRGELARFRGKEIDTAGDGFLATFDGPARAVRCARAIGEGLAPLGLEIRAGLHTGECEVIDRSIGGIAVHIGARVAALAKGGEVLVSSTVKDLVAGSGIDFADIGARVLKGVPGEWRLFRVTAA